MNKLDVKFRGTITKNKDGSTVPEDQWMVFLAKDDAFPTTLAFYLSECRRLGAGPDQIKAVQDVIERVRLWRLANPGLCKIPDVAPGELQWP